MTAFTLTTTLAQPCDAAVEAVRAATTTIVEAFDPDAMMGLADNDALHAVAALDSTEGAH